MFQHPSWCRKITFKSLRSPLHAAGINPADIFPNRFIMTVPFFSIKLALSRSLLEVRENF
jgi:hypothetical protein